jgi:hypothetical protein
MFRRRPEKPAENHLDAAIFFAWNAHHAEEAWTGRLDGKASTFLAIESAILTALTAAQLGGHLITGLSD